MKKILVTGNGFDLHHELPTSYNNFIDILGVVDESNEFDFEKIFNTVYKDIQSVNQFDLNIEKIRKLKELLNDNIWYKHFKEIKSDLTWIDFENEILSVIDIIQSFIKGFNSEIFPKKYFSGYLDNNLLFQHYLGENELIKTALLKLRILNVGSYHTGVRYWIDDTYLIRKNSLSYLDIEKIVKLLVSELEKFKLIFNMYFDCFVTPFYEINKYKINEDIVRNINEHYTFNYTQTFDKVYEKDFTRHIHGKIGEYHSIVLGIDSLNDDIEDKKYFIPFTKLYQKLNYSTDYKFIGTNNKNNDFYVFIWGHSLDSSDSIYLKEIFTLLDDDSYERKVIIIIRNQSSKGKLLVNLIDILSPEKVDTYMKNDKLIFSEYDSIELSIYLNYIPRAKFFI
ncbi:hypothetical protein EB1_23870 [Empedobacter brevis NBRC 14943 = ATCC 43319]|uniref:Bacteriophage abortive infection AbiH n=1 Tax=Empedobacter brevis NBRC 14943 = ATCC 43319 TaxID=1218108 RepID=A0A511NIU2_9FLAO|nr:AbiH family protein [Empedobacter brevis]GEM52597.1 hypothetical protein EB1_23870 [Empedobacter brevis NBRC 14943 = ATCC 43319]